MRSTARSDLQPGSGPEWQTIVAHLSQNRPRAATEGFRPGLALRVFSEPHNVAALGDLLAEVTVEPFVRFAATASPVAGKIMEFTGQVERMTRNEVNVLAQMAGGHPGSG